MPSPFNVDKKYVDQSGDEYCYIGRHPVRPKSPFVFSRVDGLDVWFTDENGVMCLNPHRTLREVKPKVVRWFNVYKHAQAVSAYSGGGCLFASKEEADTAARTATRIACIRIEFEEGEGL